MNNQEQSQLDVSSLETIFANISSQETDSNSVVYQPIKPTGFKRFSPNWWRHKLKVKVTIWAIALGIVPVASVSAIAYGIAQHSLLQQIKQSQLLETQAAAKNLDSFLSDRYSEVAALGENPLFINPQLRNTATVAQKQAVLASFNKNVDFFDSIIYFDLQGNPLFQVNSDKPFTGNYGDRTYFQQAIKTKQITMNGPGLSSSSGKLRVEFAVPVLDSQTGAVVGVIRLRTPGEYLNQLFNLNEQNQQQWYLINNENTIFASSEPQALSKSATAIFSVAIAKPTQPKPLVKIAHQSDQKSLISYAPLINGSDYPPSQIGVIISQNASIALAPIESLRLTLLLGTGVAALIVAIIAIVASARLTEPIIQIAHTVSLLGYGKFDTRVDISGDDELGQLGHNINLMAEKIEQLIKQQTIVNQQQTAVAQLQKEQREHIQAELLQLLSDMEGVATGNLTVRAEIHDGEIGIVADFFNSLTESLRELVAQVKTAANEVNNSLVNNDSSLQNLAQTAIAQAEQIQLILNSVEQMSSSIGAVANSARSAAEVAARASQTAEIGSNAMEQTVDSILKLRSTVDQTAQKIKHLGDSSRRISKVIDLIKQIALKTNYLAVNAGIEAARAGEEGQGFSVVAQEVGNLASQVSSATKEIENILASIQQETGEVVQAMKIGTAQANNSTELVEATKLSLTEIFQVSGQIDQLVQSISTETISQAETSQAVAELMKEIAQVSEHTSNSSRQVSESIQSTVAIAQQLQSSVGTFTVDS